MEREFTKDSEIISKQSHIREKRRQMLDDPNVPEQRIDRTVDDGCKNCS